MIPVDPVKREPRRFRWPARALALLGRVSDAEVARRAGCSRDTVSSERRRRGIVPFFSCRPPFEWTDTRLSLLGTAIDAQVAAELGIAKQSVGVKRRSLGIPPFRKGRPAAGRASHGTPAR